MENLPEDIPVTKETVFLFAEECILYVLNSRNIGWRPPINRENLRRYATGDVFTVAIGEALGEVRMRNQCRRLAAEALGFEFEAWLRLPLDEARRYIRELFLFYTFVLPDNPFKHLLLWNFACDLCCRAITHNRRLFVSHVLSQLYQVMYSSHSHLNYYLDLNTMSSIWNFVCAILQNSETDEGYESSSST